MSSYHSQSSLPLPSEEQMQHSARLIECIIDNMQKNGGVISFRDYMQQCLYQPGLGYYTAGSTKLGAAGDFVTAPEISPLFGACLANAASTLFGQGLCPNLLEIGAGSGKMCVDIIHRLNRLKVQWKHYYILETSGDLRQRQQDRLSQNLEPADLKKISWLNALPNGFDGLVLGNEVLDAMPVNVVLKQDDWLELGVGFDGQKFVWQTCATDSQAISSIRAIDAAGDLPQGYCSEINLNLAPWCQSVSDSCNAAVLLMIDYGYLQSQYYDARRVAGTLACFYQHRVHADPFVYPGLQDITAYVDFDAYADAAINAGFSIMGLKSQAEFLMHNGLLELAQDDGLSDMQMMQRAQQMKTLTLPAEMGEKFKVIGIQKNLNLSLPGL